MTFHYDYLRPTSAAEALALKSGAEDARYLAGGTDLLVKVKDGLVRPSALISLRNIAELRAIQETATGLRIGALCPLSEVAAHRAVAEQLPLLPAAIARMASVQIRNSATLGGNLCNCSPCADTAPPLFVLEARAEILGAAGKREVAMADLMVGPGAVGLGADDLLTAIVVDRPPPGAQGIFLKKTRVSMDLALVNLAALLVLADDSETCTTVRLCAGSVGPTPLRLTKAEQALTGQRLTPELLAEARKLAAESVQPISDIRAGADYRRQITGVFVERALRTLLDQGASA
ncbi:MAG: xanthine dehydrogenase family protein subunit M [Deltaproteobacteria bacterium]|nr:xanthine dehydrogenase family protein subunit M [Deltaproteobacteria bacterium]